MQVSPSRPTQAGPGKVPGIDTAFIAPQDLTISLGYPGLPDQPTVVTE